MKSYIYLLATIIFGYVNGIEITIHGFVYGETELHKTLVEKTNAYMKEKGLDITLRKNFEDSTTSSGDPNNIANFIEESLIKKEKGYDLYVTDTVYTGRFAKHFEDLNNYVDKNVIDLYKDGTATKTCFVDEKLVGLPLSVDYGGLYANMDLLNKYNRKVPETWDELIDTTNFIYENESPSNPELHKYIAHMPEYENGFATLLEFVHSFRNSTENKFPGFSSEAAAAALKKMKEIKENASTYDDFFSNESTIFGSLFSGNFIFFRYWYIGEKFDSLNTTVSFNPLPGNIKGVSASCVGGNNISMNRYISEERKKAAGEVLSFIHSFEEQKYGILSSNLRSAIHSTYKDKEVCEKIDCVKFSNIQSIVRPSSSSINYEQFSKKFRELAKSYINNETDMTVEEILREVDDIKRIHYVEVNSITGIVILAALSLTLILVIISYIYVLLKHSDNKFSFLPFKYWIVVIIGIVTMALYCFTGIHELFNYKCLIRPFLLSIGFNLIYIPLLLRMITIFPKKNNFSKFVDDHFSIVFVLILIINMLLNMTWYLLDPLVVNKLVISSGKNFQYCSSSGYFGNIIKNVMINLKIVILVIMSMLVFIEWNLESFKSDIRSITTTLYSNILIIGLFFIVDKLNINNVYLYFGLRASLVLIFCISTLIVLFGSKYYYISVKKESAFPDISRFRSTSFGSSNYSSNFNTMTMSKNQQFTQTKFSILNYHYQTGTTLEKHPVARPYPTLFTSTINNASFDAVFNSNKKDNEKSESSETFVNSNFNSSNNYSVTSDRLSNNNSNIYYNNIYNSNNSSNSYNDYNNSNNNNFSNKNFDGYYNY